MEQNKGPRNKPMYKQSIHIKKKINGGKITFSETILGKLNIPHIPGGLHVKKFSTYIFF